MIRSYAASLSRVMVLKPSRRSSRHISNMCEALNVPKSDVDIVKGLKSREKTVVIGNMNMSKTPQEHVERIKTTLQERASN